MAKEYVVCIDSDGCAIDSMTVKHIQGFGQAFVEVFVPEDRAEEGLEKWKEINLFSKTRGINRFKGLALILDEMDLEKETRGDYIQWTKDNHKFSNTEIEKVCKTTTNPIFEKALRWSRRVNEIVEALPTPKVFKYVKECINKLHEKADIMVVSSANRKAIETEWTDNGIIDIASQIFSQSDGSKSACIEMIKEGRNPEKMIMLGDAPGDMEAAFKTGIHFYPIIAGEEEKSWKELLETYADIFFTKGFDKELQDNLVEKMNNKLSI